MELVGDGRPELANSGAVECGGLCLCGGGGIFRKSRGGGVDHGRHEFFGLSLHVGRFVSSGGCGLGNGFLRAVRSFRTHLHRGGRQAVFVVASAVAQVALHLILFVGEFDALGELRRVLKVGHGHVENGVLLAFQAGAGTERAFEFGAFKHIGAESGRRGAAGRDVGAVDVPTGSHVAGEHHVNLGGTDALGGNTELDLRLCGRHGEQHEGEKEKKDAFHVGDVKDETRWPAIPATVE